MTADVIVAAGWAPGWLRILAWAAAEPSAQPPPLLDAVVRAAQRGEHGAFRQLYELHAPRVHAICLRITGDSVRAEEATQDTFVSVWENLRTFRGESAFASWLHRIAVNSVYMAGRSESRRGRLEVRDDAGTYSASTRADDVPARLDLEHAIARLPEVGRAVYVLNQIEGYSHEEIGSMLGIAASTSRVHLSRARQQLREALSP